VCVCVCVCVSVSVKVQRGASLNTANSTQTYICEEETESPLGERHRARTRVS